MGRVKRNSLHSIFCENTYTETSIHFASLIFQKNSWGEKFPKKASLCNTFLIVAKARQHRNTSQSPIGCTVKTWPLLSAWPMGKESNEEALSGLQWCMDSFDARHLLDEVLFYIPKMIALDFVMVHVCFCSLLLSPSNVTFIIQSFFVFLINNS